MFVAARDSVNQIVDFLGGGVAALRDWSDESPSLPGWQDYLGEVQTGLIVLDTCVFLDLYRLRGPAADELAAALHLVRDQLCVPHQVWHELASNSTTIISSIAEEAKRVSNAMEAIRRELEFLVRRHLRRTADPDRKGIRAFQAVTQRIRVLQEIIYPFGIDEADVRAALDRRAEAVTREIDLLIDKRVEPAPDSAKREAWIENSKQRVRYQRVPSWGDRRKKEPSRHNDCLIWLELLEIAARQSSPRTVVFVTSDLKAGSWIEQENGRPARAHRDLVSEMQEAARVRFVVMTPADLMAYARYAGVAEVWRDDRGWGEEVQAGSVSPVQSFFPLSGDLTA